ncbi:hypothetical protein CHS0354_028628 [Potamilus streckersoni]|uniref:Uncharacterized protein n=1 Tax=Potamilus streckersoni TaxID=2493646 RepID=A0AAE0SX95_9BIVA|nr:hypothetical protein CHS0354_028628 [Potamilus streckersoni]
MATEDSREICDDTVENLTDIYQKLNTMCAALENAEVKKNGGLDLQTIMTSAAPLFEKISAKAEKCAVLCGKIQLQHESAMKRKAVLMEGRDSGFSSSGFYAQETGEDGSILQPTEDEEFHSAEEPTNSNGEEDS